MGDRACGKPRLASRAHTALARARRRPARRQDGALPPHRAGAGSRRHDPRGASRRPMSTPLLELPVLTATAAAPRLDEARYRSLAARARALSWLSLAWMTVEGAVAIRSGVVASSIALIGFGLDRAIEGFASGTIVWRFTGHRMFSARDETRAQKLVAVQFFLLAPYVAVESLRSLIGGERADTSWVGSASAWRSPAWCSC